jgi:hypothetical protein
MNFLFILSCFCPSAFVPFLKILFNSSKLLILYLNLEAMLRSLPPSTQLTSLKRLVFSSKEKVFMHANFGHNYKLFILKSLSFLLSKCQEDVFHLLNMQTFEHKKLILCKVNLYPQNFLYPIFDYLVFLEDYLIGLAIMNDNTDEKHDVQHTIEVGNFASG